MDQALADDGRCGFISPPATVSVIPVVTKVFRLIVLCPPMLDEDIDVILTRILEVGQERVALQGITAELIQSLKHRIFEDGRSLRWWL
jgi:hypothetical protein